MRHRNWEGRLDPWMAREKPHLFMITGGGWFCTGLNAKRRTAGAHGKTPVEAYNAFMAFIAKQYFRLT